MATTPYQIKITCSTCNGTGEIPNNGGEGMISDPACSGDGVLDYGIVDGAEQIADLTDKVNDLTNKVDDILERLAS